MIQLQSSSNGTVVRIRAQPGASRTGITGEYDGALRVAISTAPERGKANKAIAQVLADAFGLSKTAVELISGTTSRNKKFLLSGKSVTSVRQTSERILEDITT